MTESQQNVAVINRWLDLFNVDNIGNILAFVILLLIIVSFIKAVVSKNNPHSMLDMFLPLGSSKMRLNGAWIITSWAFAYLTVSGHLTEWYVAAYLTAFVADRIYSRKDTKAE